MSLFLNVSWAIQIPSGVRIIIHLINIKGISNIYYCH